VTLVFYTSGHGFGHASRDIEVINALARRRPDARVVMRTTTPRWFLERSARGSIEVQPVEVDTGVAQLGSLKIDQNETARRAATFYRTFDARVQREASVLASLGASLVVGDVPPLAFAAAAAAGIPAVAVANFTWDWIYEAYESFSRLAPGVIDLIRESYARASLALRLPLHGGFEPMLGVTRDIPFIARRATRARAEVRSILGLHDETPVVLASFGGHGVAMPYERVARGARFTLIMTDFEYTGSGPGIENLKRYTSSWLDEHDLRYEDLVAAADVVVSKPGYGIVSECVANGASLLYTSRDRFPEYDVFVAEMPGLLRCGFIEQEALLAGDWQDAVDALLAAPQPSHSADVGGAQAAADALLDLA